MASPDSDDIMRRAEEIYEQRLKTTLEATALHKFVAIEPDSGDYFLSRTLSEAGAAARKTHPDRIYAALRVGHAATIEM